MESGEIRLGERRARRANEWIRLRRAAVGALPALVLAAVAAAVGGMVAPTVTMGVGIFLLGGGLLWYGGSPRRSMLPGLAAGAIPLVLGLCTRQGMDTGMCAAACGVGGVLAGSWMGWAATRRGTGRAAFLLGTSAMALLTGAMGAMCGGLVSIVALGVGYGVGLGVSSALMRRSARR